MTTALRPHKTKNRKILNYNHSIGRTKTYDYNVTRKQKDINKKNTGKYGTPILPYVQTKFVP